MIKRTFRYFTVAVLFLFLSKNGTTQETKSTANTDYKWAVGAGSDLGGGFKGVGPSAKLFLNKNNALKLEALFGQGNTFLSLFYQFHAAFPDADGLRGTAGLGVTRPIQQYGYGFTALRPTIGMDYKIYTAPISLEIDWRPAVYLGSSYGSSVEILQFGLVLRYTFR